MRTPRRSRQTHRLASAATSPASSEYTLQLLRSAHSSAACRSVIAAGTRWNPGSGIHHPRHADPSPVAADTSTRIRRATSPASSEYTLQLLRSAHDLLVDRAYDRLGIRIHGREGVDDRHPGAVAALQGVADPGLGQPQKPRSRGELRVHAADSSTSPTTHLYKRTVCENSADMKEAPAKDTEGNNLAASQACQAAKERLRLREVGKSIVESRGGALPVGGRWLIRCFRNRAAGRLPWARFLPPLSEPGVPISSTLCCRQHKVPYRRSSS